MDVHSMERLERLERMLRMICLKQLKMTCGNSFYQAAKGKRIETGLMCASISGIIMVVL